LRAHEPPLRSAERKQATASNVADMATPTIPTKPKQVSGGSMINGLDETRPEQNTNYAEKRERYGKY